MQYAVKFMAAQITTNGQSVMRGAVQRNESSNLRFKISARTRMPETSEYELARNTVHFNTLKTARKLG